MAHPQTYKGTLRFESQRVLDVVAASLGHPDCLVKLDQGSLEGTSWTVDTHHEASGSFWEPTLAILDSISRLAVEGKLQAVFHGDEDETVHFEAGIGRVLEPTAPGQAPKPARPRPDFGPWRVVELPRTVAMDEALGELEKTFRRGRCVVTRPGNGAERWVYTSGHNTYPALAFHPAGDGTIRVTRFEPPESAVRSLAVRLTWAVKRLGGTWQRDEGPLE